METGRTEEEKVGDERNRQAPKEPLPGEDGKRKSRRLSSQKRAEADERKQKASGKPGREADERKRKRREAPVEQLWERSREG